MDHGQCICFAFTTRSRQNKSGCKLNANDVILIIVFFHIAKPPRAVAELQIHESSSQGKEGSQRLGGNTASCSSCIRGLGLGGGLKEATCVIGGVVRPAKEESFKSSPS